MNDAEFLHGFHTCTLAEFHHRDHVRLTWLLVRRDGPYMAGEEIETGIRRFASVHGQQEKYHQTMTQFWVKVIAHFIARKPEIADFDAFVRRDPQVLNTMLPFKHWTRETMMSDRAKREWVPPDLLEMPA